MIDKGSQITEYELETDNGEGWQSIPDYTYVKSCSVRKDWKRQERRRKWWTDEREVIPDLACPSYAVAMSRYDELFLMVLFLSFFSRLIYFKLRVLLKRSLRIFIHINVILEKKKMHKS